MEEDKIIKKTPSADEELKETAREAFAKISRQSLIRGGQAMCQVILNKITAFEKAPGNKSNNDHKRLIKDIKRFCEISVSSKANETEQETVQN